MSITRRHLLQVVRGAGLAAGGGGQHRHRASAHEGRKLRALAVTTAKRSAAAPDAPTMAESGLAGYELGSWQAVFAPASTPKPIIDRLQTEIDKILKMPDAHKRDGARLSGIPPDQPAAMVKADVPRLGRW